MNLEIDWPASSGSVLPGTGFWAAITAILVPVRNTQRANLISYIMISSYNPYILNIQILPRTRYQNNELCKNYELRQFTGKNY